MDTSSQFTFARTTKANTNFYPATNGQQRAGVAHNNNYMLTEAPLTIRQALRELWRAVMRPSHRLTQTDLENIDRTVKEYDNLPFRGDPPKLSFVPDGWQQERILDFADRHGWYCCAYQPANRLLSFYRKGTRINVYYTKMTVATCLDHPVKGKTQLFRRNVSWSLLERIFANPRVHTSKGYQKNK